MIRRLGFLLFVFLPLVLAACAGTSDEGDDSAHANAIDPQLASALQAQIMVDPSLAQQANGDSVRPPSQPYSAGVPAEGVAANGGTIDLTGLMKAPAPVPASKDCPECAAARESVTLGGLAARQPNAATASCAAKVQYGAGWAQRLPADLPLFPQARVIEAAGADGDRCKLRIVSFSTAQPMQTMLDWYYTRAMRAGYTAEHQLDGDAHILGGTRQRDDGAYVLYLTARQDGGTDIDLVANTGR